MNNTLTQAPTQTAVITPQTETPSHVDVVSSGTLPVPSKPAFPTKRATGTAVTLEQSKELMLNAIFQRCIEIGRIGFNSSLDCEQAGRDFTLSPQFEDIRNHEMKLLLGGSSRLGYVVKKGADGVETRVETLTELTNFVKSFTNVNSVKRMSNGRKLFMFETPADYIAYTSEVRIEEMFAKGHQASIRIDFTDDEDTNHKPVYRRTVLYTPENVGLPLQATNVVSFIYNDNAGLELWQPGQFIGALHRKELEAWVYLNLFKH